MYTKKELIEDGLYDDSKNFSHKVITKFYQDQLKEFEKIGMGKLTENDTVVTPSLIAITRKRLGQLLPISAAKQYLRKVNVNKQKGEDDV